MTKSKVKIIKNPKIEQGGIKFDGGYFFCTPEMAMFIKGSSHIIEFGVRNGVLVSKYRKH